MLDVLVNRFGLDGIRQKVQRPLAGLRVACYYGCLLTRPPEVVAFDNPENPTCMDDLVAAIGAEPVAWPYKTECCGASLSITQSKVVGRLGRKLLSMARQAGARCIVVACPLCQLNLDLRQSDAAKAGDDIARHAGPLRHAASGPCPGNSGQRTGAGRAEHQRRFAVGRNLPCSVGRWAGMTAKPVVATGRPLREVAS